MGLRGEVGYHQCNSPFQCPPQEAGISDGDLQDFRLKSQVKAPSDSVDEPYW